MSSLIRNKNFRLLAEITVSTMPLNAFFLHEYVTKSEGTKCISPKTRGKLKSRKIKSHYRISNYEQGLINIKYGWCRELVHI